MSTKTVDDQVTSTGGINRWAVLIAAMLMLFCTGGMYSFSVFRDALVETNGIPLNEVMTAYSINMGLSPIPMIIGGFFVDRRGARWLILIGGALFASGWMLSASATTGTELALSYGLLAGMGQGLAYGAGLNNAMRFFPDKRGLAAGLITAANGGATVILAPVEQGLLSSVGVNKMFLILGAVFAVVALIAFALTRVAPDGYRPAGWNPPAPAAGAPAVANLGWKQMLGTARFWIIFGLFICGAFSGLLIAAHAKPIAMSMYALAAGTAALFVSLYSLANMFGRIVFGAVSDRLGRVRTLILIFTVIAVSLVVLVAAKGTGTLSTIGLGVGLVGLGLCFGGVMGVMPALVMGSFGPKNQGVNYGIAFSAYSVSAVFAPQLAANIAGQNGGDFSQAFFVAIAAAAVGVVLTIVLQRLTRTPKH